MSKPSKPRPRQGKKSVDGGPPRRDNERAARALVDAALLSSDAKASEKHGITLRTLQNYRAALKTDPQLSRLYAELSRDAARAHWSDELDATLRVGIRKLARLIEKVESPSPESLEAVTGAVAALSEIAMTRDMLAQDDQQLSPKSALARDAAPTHALN